VDIQFIVVGWHYSYPEWINGLIELNSQNEMIDVFWSCHREPTDIVKENFNWKLFENIGLEEGAYTQALEYLDLDDETILFLVHDDLIIKDWNFISVCVNALGKYKVLGNGINYPAMFDPQKIERDKKNIEWVSADWRYLFKEPMMCKTIRSSFLVIKWKDLKRVGGFNPIWLSPDLDEDGNAINYGGIGNLGQTIVGYKFTKIFGKDNIGYLSKEYLNSKYVYECARGKITKEFQIEKS
jgi:hypothetical protein